MQTKNLS